MQPYYGRKKMKKDNRFRGPRKPIEVLQATHVPPTPSKRPQRPSVWFLGGIDEQCDWCDGSGEDKENWDYNEEENISFADCPFCSGTGWVYLDDEEKK
jgi:hypothetical protein